MHTLTSSAMASNPSWKAQRPCSCLRTVSKARKERERALRGPPVWQAALHVFLSAAGIHGDHLPSSRNGIVFASRLVRHVGGP
jgi:hypothetical protein